uniref:Uncharacterized protein n=1 Tax=Arundo donax TaxID=35708 RepID=A0A0A9R8B6_ARUDO
MELDANLLPRIPYFVSLGCFDCWGSFCSLFELASKHTISLYLCAIVFSIGRAKASAGFGGMLNLIFYLTLVRLR